MTLVLSDADFELMHNNPEAVGSTNEASDRAAVLQAYMYAEYLDDESAFLDWIQGEGGDTFKDPLGVFQHEKAHFEDCKALGMSELRFGLYRLKETDRVYGALVKLGAFHDIPRLAIAATYIAPVDPSSGDMEYLHDHNSARSRQVIEK